MQYVVLSKNSFTRFVRIIAIFSLLPCTTDSYAQKSFISRVDSFLHARFYGVDIDSNYLQRPAWKWHVRVGTNFTSSEFSMTSKQNNYETGLKTDTKITTSVKVSYSGLSLSLSINPASFSGKDTDWGLNLNTYGRKVGFDLSVSLSKTMKGYVSEVNQNNLISSGDVQQKMLFATGYYAFNDQRFAYAAGFQQSYIQKRSAGSWLLSASFFGSSIQTEETYSVKAKINNLNIALGGGYGYNWVPGRRWLLHISCTPTLSVYSHSSITLDGDYAKMKMHFPEFIILSKGAILYHYKKLFIGTCMTHYTTINGDENLLRMMNTRWYIRNFVGFRF